MTDERRKGKRHPAKMPVKLRPTEGVTPYSQNAESVNISETGLLFLLEQPIAVGSHVDLSFVMPGEVTGGLPMKIRCSARVVRVDTYDRAQGKSGIAAHIERFETIVAEQET
jgi:hypothetical protein